MLRGVWQALNCLSIHATYCMIVAGASPGKTKMWAAVRENGDFSRSWIMSKRINICSIFFHHPVATPFLCIEAIQTRSIAQPLCDSRASCQNGGRPPPWILKICSFFHVAFVCMTFWFLVQKKFAEICYSVDELWSKNDFPDGGRRHLEF